MERFIELRAMAKDGRLPSRLDAAYIASEEFAARIMGRGERGTKDRVAMTLYLLERLALDPRAADTMREELAVGWVNLDFFGVVNPVGLFELQVGSEQLAAIRSAVEANLRSPMVDAARRVRKWRGRARIGERRVEALWRHFHDRLPWPRRDGRSAWTQEQEAQCKALADEAAAYAARLRDKRRNRLRALGDAATPGLSSWTDLLCDAAASVLVRTNEEATA